MVQSGRLQYFGTKHKVGHSRVTGMFSEEIKASLEQNLPKGAPCGADHPSDTGRWDNQCYAHMKERNSDGRK